MAGRIRTLKPEWLENQRLGSCSDAARLLSVALLLLADDHGRGRAAVPYIAGQVWPYALEKVPETLARVSAALRELLATGYIHLYEVDGQDYFEILGWGRHQRVDKPGKPRVPDPSLGTIRETPAKVRETLATDHDHDHDHIPRSSVEGGTPREEPPEEGASPPAEPAGKRVKPIPPEQARQVAESIARHVVERDPGCRKLQPGRAEREQVIAAWADAIRLLHERDGRAWVEIADVWRWARKDPFWSANVLSGPTFRKQFDKLVQARQRPAHTNGRRPSPPQPQLLDLGAVPAVEEARRKGTP